MEFLKSLFDHVLPSYALQEGRKWYSSSYQFWTNALVNTPNWTPTSDLTIPATLWRSCLLEYKHVHAQYLTLPGRAVSCYIHQWIDKLASWTLLWSSLTSLTGYHELDFENCHLSLLNCFFPSLNFEEMYCKDATLQGLYWCHAVIVVYFYFTV